MLNFEEVKVGLKYPDLHARIHIALANVRVLDDNVEASYLCKSNLSRKRLKPFANLLNEVASYRNTAGKKIDLIVFPEVSVPHAWESMIVAWARKHRIGVVCGLEHRIERSCFARNEVLAALPYKADNERWACVPVRRLKRHYSPEEKFILNNEGLKVPDPTDSYQLLRWRGASFAIYNCYELASIEDRALFKGKVDFIVGTEFNRDVHYFANIVESAACDLHCFVIQVNDSRYGDSRVVSPSKWEKLNPVRIKGGENLTFLTTYLDLKALRTHQRKGYGLQKESDDFKSTPPGIDMGDIQFRIGLGK